MHHHGLQLVRIVQHTVVKVAQELTRRPMWELEPLRVSSL